MYNKHRGRRQNRPLHKEREIIRMKVFVYDKKTSKTIAAFRNVICVEEDVTKNILTIQMQTSDETACFNTKKVKTRIYQN